MLMLTGKGGEGKSRIGVVLRALLGTNMKTGSVAKVDIVAFQAEVSRMLNINQELHETIVEDLIAPPDNFFEGPEAPRVPLKPGAVVVERDVANMNRVYSLGLTEEEILKIADGIKTGYLKDAERTDGLMEHLDYFFVEDRIAYLAEIAKILNLSQETFEEYIWMLEHPIVY